MKKYKLYWTLLTINAGLPLDKLVVFMLSILYYFQIVKVLEQKHLLFFVYFLCWLSLLL